MRILLVIDHLSSGGAQRQLALLACRLAARGHGVDCFVYHRHNFQRDQLAAAGVRILEHPKKTKYSIAPIKSLRQYLQKNEYDIVLSFLTTPNLYCILARFGLKNPPPLVISERSSTGNPNRGWRTALAERCYRFANRMTVNSHHLRTYFLDNYPWATERVSTIWNGVELERFKFQPMLQQRKPLRLVAVGQIGRFKNAHCLVEAMAIARDKHHCELTIDWIARRWPNLKPAEQEYVEELDARLKQLGLEAQWRWVAERQHIEHVLGDYHALVHTSVVEGLPNVICEALATGRPVLASDTLDHPRLVQHEKTGYLFNPASPASLAEAMVRLSELDDGELQAMGTAARGFAEGNLSADIYVDQYEKLFLELLDE